MTWVYKDVFEVSNSRGRQSMTAFVRSSCSTEWWIASEIIVQGVFLCYILLEVFFAGHAVLLELLEPPFVDGPIMPSLELIAYPGQSFEGQYVWHLPPVPNPQECCWL
jgi:hypothetical protein